MPDNITTDLPPIFSEEEKAVLKSPMAVSCYYTFAFCNEQDPVKRIHIAVTDNPFTPNARIDLHRQETRSNAEHSTYEIPRRLIIDTLRTLSLGKLTESIAEMAGINGDTRDLFKVRPALTNFYFHADSDRTEANGTEVVELHAYIGENGVYFSKKYSVEQNNIVMVKERPPVLIENVPLATVVNLFVSLGRKERELEISNANTKVQDSIACQNGQDHR